MSNPLKGLNPPSVWKNFSLIAAIPHGSGNEGALRQVLVNQAAAAGCATEVDRVGNLLIRIPASAGHEGAPTVVLQGHLDMVCEKNEEKVFNFLTDAIELQREGEWITANGTTLGSDNGIGVAMGLAIMEDTSCIHGPLELLLTVDEESGLNGALGLSSSLLSGKVLLNLDSEDDGVFFVGCAGGRDSHLSLPLKTVPVERATYQITVTGLKGGHSGLDIIHNRANAIKLLARALRLIGASFDLNLSAIAGGDKHNAIPREARASVQLDPSDVPAVARMLQGLLGDFLQEFHKEDPGISLTIVRGENTATMFDQSTTHQLIDLILALPTGVIAMSREMKGLVETSTHLARVRVDEKRINLLTSSRSSCRPALDAVAAQIAAIGNLAGALVLEKTGYPGWQPDMDSFLIALARDTWHELFDEVPRFEAVHAGLECGIIKDHYPQMEVLSFGPEIQNPHSPDERVFIPSVERSYRFLTAFLTKLTSR